ncbi:MAG: serine phosphatase [Leptospiraceae bacterium]|nr:MAG: serine phosphatase [Leptospiraceae bacterium]
MLNNFFTVADLNYAIFTLFAAFYLISIKNKNKYTKHLIIFFFVLAFMDIAYFLSSLLIDPIWRFHRWITVSMALLGTVHSAYFVMNYPRKSWKRFPEIYFYTFYFIDLMIIIAFIYTSLKVDKVYKFDGHFWDVNEAFWGQIVGLFILINGLFTVISGIIRFFQIRNARLPIILIVFGFILIVMIPSITNLMNRLFILTRDEHQHIWGLLGITGSFILFVTYVNYTKERTTLLSKLYAISLLTILIILQFVNFFVLQERNIIYDQIHKERNHRIINNINYRPEELEYFFKINSNFEFELLYGKENVLLPLEDYKREAAIMLLQIQYLNKQEISKQIIPYVQGYLNWIREIERNYPDYTRQQVLDLIFKNKRKIQLLESKIKNIPEEKFETKFKSSILEKNLNDPIYKHFLSPEVVYKKEVLNKIPVIYHFDERIFKYIPISKDFWKNTFVNYYVIENNQLYLVGYSYKIYRIFIAEIANILFYIIVISSLLILLGYPVFFLVSVLRPLRKLIYGLKKVNKGDFSVYLDVSVNDELGYVTRSFNQMVDSIREKNQQLEEYANKLEQKVQERTKDLENSLREIAALKEKQDGDYFLTSLLVKPLNANEIGKEGDIKVDFILRQFKQFKFKKWESEIGGDFCAAHKIQLQNKNYSFIVNADAMGKSIQGAGGSLVLGSVLEAIVERTKYQDEVKTLFPEKWLKYAFVELHKVLESLNGSMLITIVMVLIDDNTGFMYFLNAEHPDIILYRNGKAEFIKPNKYLIKLGLPADGFISISTFKLEPGDILFLGSDGKDDIVLGYNKDGTRKINFDEKLFLKIVEETEGNLEHIYSNLKERGEFIDDLSIIRIEYTPAIEKTSKRNLIHSENKKDFEEAKEYLVKYKETGKIEFIDKAINILENLVNQYPENYVIRKFLINSYLRKKEEQDIRKAITHLEQLFYYYPEDYNVLLQIVKLLYKKRIYAKAAEYGEIYLLRNPENKEILTLLVQLYDKLKNEQKLNKYKNVLNKLAIG